jgi:hypothetical protein
MVPINPLGFTIRICERTGLSVVTPRNDRNAIFVTTILFLAIGILLLRQF